jgi:hypothetical protein
MKLCNHVTSLAFQVTCTCYILLTQILGFPDGSTFALPSVSIGIHHGYPVTLVLSIVPVNLAGRFSKNDLTPSELSLTTLAKLTLVQGSTSTYGLPNNS